jgi:hypothetical protein
MPITRADFPALTDDLESIFNEVSRTKIADMKGLSLFDVRDEQRRTHDHLLLHGANGIEEVTPGGDLPTVNTDEGDSVTYTQRYFGAKFAVTKEMRLFDLHQQIETVARSITEDAWDKVDQSMADVLLYGTATSYTDVYGGTVTSVGPDGLALFSASHTNGVSTSSRQFSNLIKDGTNNNPALSRAAIVQTRANAMVYKDPEGLVRPVKLDTIIVPPSLEDAAERILNSAQMSGTGNNDINPLKGKFKLIVWERLETRSDATDTSAYWFMADSSKVGETLKAYFAERPSLDAPEQVYKNKNWEYSVDYFYSWGTGFPGYIFGSTGVN